ncbi:MAG: flavodoxin family protein [Planctomycetota bacterium]|jgi:multimeric flavodoxin WrbA
MNALIISGSRNPKGQTAKAAEALAKGIEAGGGSSEKVFLPAVTMERCRQCDERGWGLCRSEGRCVIEDDFAGLVDEIRGADAVAFANPVYFSDLSESLKAFLDRLRRITRHEAGKAGIEGKAALGICVAGGGGGGAPRCCAEMDRTLATIGFDVIDMVPARRQNLDNKIAVLETTGRWLAGQVKA